MTTEEEKISSIYQQGKEQGPPAHLDSAILKAAHEAVEQTLPADKSSVVKSPFSGGWPAMASIAAVLVITVILVPLIKQEVPPTASFDMIDDEQMLMKEEDAIGRLEPKQQAVKSKKRLLPESSELRQEAKPQLNMYQYSADSVERSKQNTVEEAVMPKRMATPSPALSRSMPASAATGATSPGEREVKSEADVLPESPAMLMADEALPTVVLTVEKWLEKIRQLIDAGELDTAQAELDEFKESYPDEVIDPSIIRQITERP